MFKGFGILADLNGKSYVGKYDLYMQYLLSFCKQNKYSFFKSYLNIYLPFYIYFFM